MLTRRVFIYSLGMGLISVNAEAQGLLERLGLRRVSRLSEEIVREGLREALMVGIDRTVKLVGKKDGYFKNIDLKILMPKSLRKFERPLRVAGYGAKIDEYILSMNRAAEAAAPLAKKIFVSAIAEMPAEDARRILKGKNIAATEYLKVHTRDELKEAFVPDVREIMKQYKVTEKHQLLVKRYSSLPFSRTFLDGSIEEYTTNQALEGLFLVLGQEEKRIRTKPLARTTDLLKQVFGN